MRPAAPRSQKTDGGYREGPDVEVLSTVPSQGPTISVGLGVS